MQPERPNGHGHVSCKAWRGPGSGEEQQNSSTDTSQLLSAKKVDCNDRTE